MKENSVIEKQSMKIFSKEEIEESSLKYFKGNDLASNVFISKYALKKGEEYYELNPNDMHWRMAKEFARVDEKYKIKDKSKLSDYGKSRDDLNAGTIFRLFKDFKYIIPQGSIMSMLGNTDAIGSLSNCFVLGQPEDSYGGIMHKDQELVQLMKRRGGVGLDISTLRPKDSEVSNAAGTSTGAVSFMNRFSNSTREVAQNGRRGALMLTMDVRHPDIMDFINSKKDKTKITGANISVMLRNDFMESVKKKEFYLLRFPCAVETETLNETIEGVDFSKLSSWKITQAKEIYDSIIDNAWEGGEPGQMFIDRHWTNSPDGVYPDFKMKTTNPCGEIGMGAYDACRLMAINLFSFVNDPFTKNANFDYDKFYEVCYEQQRLADDLIDLELECITRILAKIYSDEEDEKTRIIEADLWENIYDTTKNGRRTGCGFTGLGDTLAALNVSYNSSKNYVEAIMYRKMKAELDCTIDLAIERGSFEAYDTSLEYATKYRAPLNNFYKDLKYNFYEQYQRMIKYGRRNISWSTCAPTGTVSLLTETTSGIEPLFKPYYIRRKKVNPSNNGVRVDFTDKNGDTWQEFPVIHPKFKEWYKLNSTERDLDIELLSSKDLDVLFKKSPWFGSTAEEINWEDRINIQSIIQRFTTHSISSTINLPKSTTKEEIGKIYINAYDKGLKGITIYREGSRDGVLITKPATTEFEYKDAPKRPKTLPCITNNVTIKGEKWVVIVGLLNDKPYEVFCVPQSLFVVHDKDSLLISKLGKGKYILHDGEENDKNYYSFGELTTNMSSEEAIITRLISTSLRHGANIQFVVEQLSKSRGDITSFSKAIGRVLKAYIPKVALVSRLKCSNPECGSNNVILEEGCSKCVDCGQSACG